MIKRNIKVIIPFVVLLIVVVIAIALMHKSPNPVAPPVIHGIYITNLTAEQLKQLPTHLNKTVTIKGIIININKQFYAASTDKSGGAVLLLDGSANKLDLPKYQSYTHEDKLITGKLVRSSPSAPLVLQVSAIKAY